MLTIRELVVSLHGAWLLAKRDPGGMNWFDISVGGFWRSFWAAAVAFPFYLLLMALPAPPGQGYAASPTEIFLVRCLGYGMAWVAFPLVAIPLTRLIDRSSFYVPMVIALNWASVIQSGIMTVAILLTFALPDAMGSFVTLVGYGVVLYYAYFVTRVSLNVGVATAVAFVLIGSLLEILIYSFTDGLLPAAGA
jgi:hypothetical protein